MHTRNLSRNVCARAFMRIFERASTSINARTSVCLFICGCDYVGIRVHAPVIIRACGGYSACMYVVLSNTLLLVYLDHGYMTAHVYIWSAIMNSLYHSL